MIFIVSGIPVYITTATLVWVLFWFEPPQVFAHGLHRFILLWCSISG